MLSIFPFLLVWSWRYNSILKKSVPYYASDTVDTRIILCLWLCQFPWFSLSLFFSTQLSSLPIWLHCYSSKNVCFNLLKYIFKLSIFLPSSCFVDNNSLINALLYKFGSVIVSLFNTAFVISVFTIGAI